MRLYFSTLSMGHPFYPQTGLGFVRIVMSLLLIYHGWEIFDQQLMNTYVSWETFKGPAAKLLVYSGKAAELLAGILFLLGVLTRLAALLAMGTFTYITFFVGQGRFWYEDQHPFLFVLLALLFFFTGPGAWSIDAKLMVKNRFSK